MRLLGEPNAYGCYDSQCLDSTWDHDCPTVPAAKLSVAIDGYDEVNNAQTELLADEQPPTRGVGWCAPSP